MKSSYTIVSLWEMLSLNSGRMLRSTIAISMLLSWFQAKPEFQKGVLNFLEETPDLGAKLRDLHATLLEIDAPLTAIALERMLDTLQKPVSQATFRIQLEQVISRLPDELSAKTFLVLTAGEAALFDPTIPHFGSDVRSKFPSIEYDIDEAAKCLAVGRSTAAVFHSMRVLEKALRALALCLALTPPGRNWGDILKVVREERAKRGNSWSENDLFQDLYARLDAIKDAWRNSTMHVENVYTEEEARKIFTNVGDFMTKIASRMGEDGLPLA